MSFNLTITGTNFNTQSVVYWNGVAKPITNVSATKLNVTIPATDLQTAGAIPVWVVNPAPGGSKTANLTFTINPVAPTVDSLAPLGAYVGGPAFTLVVNGQNFTSGAAVKWNGVAKTTTFGSATRLNATILVSDLTTAKIINITVTNPGTSGTSNTVQFPVTYGAPTITTTTPTFAKAGGAAFSLKLTGTNF
ncbi:MAG: IPT/TIG domain-containing protein, partial [Methanomicrobiales archaeon]|nr:IPT/TIG domain-containing protein [Methanomicrobiales archaeon]